MSTGSISLDILLSQIRENATVQRDRAIQSIRKRYPTLSEKEALEIYAMIIDDAGDSNCSELVVTAPPSFSLKAKQTKNVVASMISGAKKNILITGYSLSDYFGDLVDAIIQKSQEGVFVKFFVNNIESQTHFDKLCRYKGKFLKIYNYPKHEDTMSALHAKVISVDQKETLITSANLSYHGQEGNIELGTLTKSKEIAIQLDDIFTKLLFQKVFIEV